jgi:hypothetical protein
MSSALERRYRRLVQMYPARWRSHYGEEVIGTLLDAATAGRRWPSPRETAGLLIGASRERLRGRGITTPGAVLRDGLHIGATLIVAANASIAVFASFSSVGSSGERVAGMPSEWSKAELLWVLAFAALVHGSRILGPAIVAMTSALCATSAVLEISHVPFPATDGWSMLIASTVVARLLLPTMIILWMAARGEHPARSPLWVLTVAPAVSVITQGFDAPLSIGTTVLLLTGPLLVAALRWAPVDARPAIGAAVFLAAVWVVLGAVAAGQTGMLPITFTWPLEVVAALPLFALAMAGPVGARRSFHR